MKLVACLAGGIGNQMFQYAAARSLALRTGAELVLDSWSGFIRDREYRRHYELGALPIQARYASPCERLPIWIYRAMKRGRQGPVQVLETYWFGRFLNETRQSHMSELRSLSVVAPTWMTGCWQSPKYFSDVPSLIRSELSPPEVLQEPYASLAKRMDAVDSVAVGVRLYEESSDPATHARGRQLKSIGSVRSVIQGLRAERPNAEFFIFCTQESPLLDQLGLSNSTHIVTPARGYRGTIETLWLLTRCRHHVLTNSSFYWWGAWLSAKRYEGRVQRIFMADNFINDDGRCESWISF